MTKVKVKGSFLSKPLERSRPAAEHFDDDDDDEEENEEDHFPGRSNYMPIVRANNKRKRGPRGAGRYPQRDSSGFQSSDSALGTSSGEDDVGDSAENHADRQSSGDFGYEENSAIDIARRGSVRLKVKPSKFRENPSQIHVTPEGRSPVKKRPVGESSNSRHPFSAKDFVFAERQQDHLTNELRTALMVVRKIMKMEAAEPFNIPVDPVALGIPDYFDIVKRPMDLGTICKNLEKGGKYRGSRDVYEDVQLVWTNCRIYNQKGDPILELLARVKKNFMKYWTAAGLYTEKSPATFKFQGRSPEVESGGSSLKERQEDIDFGRSKKMAKYLKEEEISANSIAKLSSYEQGLIDSKAARSYPEDFVSGFRRDQGVTSSVMIDDLDSFYSNREGPMIISVYKTHKKKKLEQQGNELSKETRPKGYVHEGQQKSVGRGLALANLSHTDKSTRQKEADLHGAPGKSRRVSGTGHHKADCSCVVCTGVRRKLAREGKLGSPLATLSTMSAESPGAPSERILVRLKTEGSSDRHKSSTGAKEGRENYKMKDIEGEKANLSNSDRVRNEESDINSLDAEPEMAADRDGTAKEGIVTIGTKGSLENDTMLESAKAFSEEGLKGAADEIEDKEDALLNDEHLADMLDAETEHQVGGVRYFRASYEMPLRKVNPSILEISQRLFGSRSPWSHGRSLSRHSSKGCLENSIFSTVSVLLGTKGA